MSAQDSNGSTGGKSELTQEQEWIAQGETLQEQERRATELSLGRIRAMIKDQEAHDRPKSLRDIQGANLVIRLWHWLMGPDLAVYLLLGVVVGFVVLAAALPQPDSGLEYLRWIGLGLYLGGVSFAIMWVCARDEIRELRRQLASERELTAALMTQLRDLGHPGFADNLR